MEQSNRSKYLIAAASLVLIIAAIFFLFIYQKGPKKIKPQENTNDVKQLSEISLDKRPYITLTPTSDGAEIIISIENMGQFDKIEYELTYMADNPQISGEKIERGSTGTDVNTKDSKYKKSILLGTASRGVRNPDKGITDGKLTMHLTKSGTEYLSETNWDFIQAGAKPEEIHDRSSKFTVSLPSLGKDYWIILADTIGLPAQNGDFKTENVLLPVYGSFSIAPKFSQNTKISIKVDGKVTDHGLYSYNQQDSKWQKLEVNFDSSSNTVTSKVDSLATFVVVSSK